MLSKPGVLQSLPQLKTFSFHNKIHDFSPCVSCTALSKGFSVVLFCFVFCIFAHVVKATLQSYLHACRQAIDFPVTSVQFSFIHVSV